MKGEREKEKQYLKKKKKKGAGGEARGTSCIQDTIKARCGEVEWTC